MDSCQQLERKDTGGVGLLRSSEFAALIRDSGGVARVMVQWSSESSSAEIATSWPGPPGVRHRDGREDRAPGPARARAEGPSLRYHKNTRVPLRHSLAGAMQMIYYSSWGRYHDK